MSHGIWLRKAPLSLFCCFFLCFIQECPGCFHPLTLLWQVWSHFIKSQENLCWVPVCALYTASSLNPHHCLMKVSAIFLILQLSCTEMDCWHTAAKQQLLCVPPAPSSPRRHSGYTDKPETTKPGSSAESLAVHAVTLLRLPGDSRNHAGF